MQIAVCLVRTQWQNVFEVGAAEKMPENAFADERLVIVERTCCAKQSAHIVLAGIDIGNLFLHP